MVQVDWHSTEIVSHMFCVSLPPSIAPNASIVSLVVACELIFEVTFFKRNVNMTSIHFLVHFETFFPISKILKLNGCDYVGSSVLGVGGGGGGGGW